MAAGKRSRPSTGASQQLPPVATRFQPGQSGNPGGRPKKDRDFVRLINAELDAVVTVMRDGKRVKLTKRQLVATSLVNEAAKGKLKAIDALVRYGGLSSGSDDRHVEVDPQVLTTFLARFSPRAEGDRK